MTSQKNAVRIQRKRIKGFDLQCASRSINGLDCVYVGRPSMYGNPFDHRVMGRGPAVLQFRQWLNENPMFMTEKSVMHRKALFENLDKLKGKNLACYCSLDEPCHADVLLDLLYGKTGV